MNQVRPRRFRSDPAVTAHPPITRPHILLTVGAPEPAREVSTVRETVEVLQRQLDRVAREGRQVEAPANVLLLSRALLNAADEYLRGMATHRPSSGKVRWLIEKVAAVLSWRRRARVRRWREAWQKRVDHLAAPTALAAVAALAEALGALPPELLAQQAPLPTSA